MILKQMPPMKGWTRASQKSHANQRKILWSVFPLFFVHRIVSCFLLVVQVLLSISSARNFYWVLPICVRKLVEKPYLRIPGSKTWRHFKLPCRNEARQKMWMSSSTLLPVNHCIGWLYVSISSINHAHYILCLVICFHICKVVVVQSLYITFPNHNWGTLDGCMGCSLVKFGSFRVLRHKADSW